MKLSRNLDDKQILNIIAEIDRLKIIQAQHITNGDLEKALDISNTISELAKKINSPYILDEQKDYLSNVSASKDFTPNAQDIRLIGNELKKNYYDLLEIEHVVEAHALVEDFKKKFGSHFNLLKISSIKECIQDDERIWKRYLQEQDNKVENLEELESQFFLSIKKGDTKTANQIIENAWDNIYKLEGSKKEMYQNKWGTLEHNLIQGLKYEEYERITNNRKRIRKILDDSKYLEQTAQHDKAINILSSELNATQINDIHELKMELEIRLADIQTSKTLIDNTHNNIQFLKNQLQDCLKKEKLEEAVNHCNEIIKISQDYGLKEMRQEHELLLKDLKNEMVQREINGKLKREQQLREQQLREQQLREQQLREQQLREQQLREQQLREQQLKELQIKKLIELKDKVLILNKEGLESINNRNISKALEKYKAIRSLITGYIKN